MQRIIALSLALAVAGNTSFAQRPVSPTWTLVEDLRIGEDQGPKSFNDVRGIAATKNGNIFVLDFKTREIRLFDARGNYLKQVSRDGAGPGEIRNANGLAVGDNDVVWVNDPGNSRFSLFKSDGSFLKQVLVPIKRYGYIWEGVIDGRGRALDVISGPTSRDAAGNLTGTNLIRTVDEQGKEDTLAFPSCKGDREPPNPSYLQFKSSRGSMMMGIPFLPRGKVLFTKGGRTWCTTSGEYRLWSGVVGAANREVVNIKLDPPRVSDAERKKALDQIDSLTRAYGTMTVGDPALIPKTKPVLAGIYADAASRVWVRLTDTPEDTPVFDVFDTDGKAVARVQSRGKVNLSQTWITDSNVYTVVLDENDVPTIVRYRIVR